MGLHDTMLTFRVTGTEAAAIRKAAETSGVTLSAFLRQAALDRTDELATSVCASCGAREGVIRLAWVVRKAPGATSNLNGSTFPAKPGVTIGRTPFSVTGSVEWSGWKCRDCCLRDYGWWISGSPAVMST